MRARTSSSRHFKRNAAHQAKTTQKFKIDLDSFSEDVKTFNADFVLGGRSAEAVIAIEDDPLPWLTAALNPLRPGSGFRKFPENTRARKFLVMSFVHELFTPMARLIVWRLLAAGVPRANITTFAAPRDHQFTWFNLARTLFASDYVVTFAYPMIPPDGKPKWHAPLPPLEMTIASKQAAGGAGGSGSDGGGSHGGRAFRSLTLINVEQPSWWPLICVDQNVDRVVTWSTIERDALLKKKMVIENDRPVDIRVFPGISIQPIPVNPKVATASQRSSNPFIFYGMLKGRRQTILNKVFKKFPLTITQNLQGKKKYDALSQCPAVLNLHHTDGPWILEVHRLSEVFASGACCITEWSDDMQGATEAMGDALTVVPAGDVDAIVAACRAFKPVDPIEVQRRFVAWLATSTLRTEAVVEEFVRER